jgi:hypothetical protein
MRCLEHVCVLLDTQQLARMTVAQQLARADARAKAKIQTVQPTQRIQLPAHCVGHRMQPVGAAPRSFIPLGEHSIFKCWVRDEDRVPRLNNPQRGDLCVHH